MRRWITDALLCALALCLIVYAAARGAAQSGYDWQWDRVAPFFLTFTDTGVSFGPLLSSGLLCTLRISAWGLTLALAVGLAAALLRLAGGSFSRAVSLAYVQGFRNTPLMVQLLALYALMPAQWGISAEGVAVIALGLFEGAYMAEIFRAGIQAVPRGQWEAALSLGLAPGMVWRHVALPQALRQSLPPLVSQGVSLIKDSSLASVIAVSELAQQSGLVVSDTFLAFEVWLPVAGIYLVLALLLSGLAACLESRLSRGLAPAVRAGQF